MKKFFIGLTALAFCAIFLLGGIVNVAHADTQAEINKITVSGMGEVSLTPDLVVVNVGVDTLNEDLGTAQSENAESVKAVEKALLTFGISEENIKTKDYFVYQKYDYSRGGKELGYQVSNYIEFKTKDIDNLGAIISEITEKGANRINGINFDISEQDTAYKQALELAFENAKDKAKAFSEQDFTNAEIIEENCYSFAAKEINLLSMRDETPFYKGEYVVKANVKVVFSY